MSIAGGLSLQQLPYECPDPSFEYVPDHDILRPAVGMLASDVLNIECDELTETVNSHDQSSKTASKDRKQRDQAPRPGPVLSRNNVEPFAPKPDSVEKPKSDLEVLLESQYIKNPYAYAGNIDILSSYSSEPPDSTASMNLRAQAKHALANAWKHDPIRCSVKAAFQIAQDLAASPEYGLTKEEYIWITGDKLPTVKKTPIPVRVDFERVRKIHESMMNLGVDGKIDGADIDQELDEFYGADGTDLRPVGNDSDDEGFSEPAMIATTVVSLPNKSLMEPGVTPGGIFQDSAIVMDEGYAEYSLAHSCPNTGKTSTGAPNDWPSFKAEIAPLRLPEKKGRWLGLAGDQKQCEWPGRRQGPYDLDGLSAWVHASWNDDVEMLDESEGSISDPQDIPGFFTPQPVPRKTSVECDVEASASNILKATGAPITAALAVSEVHDEDQMVDARVVETTNKTPLPAETTSSFKLVQRAQRVSEPMEETSGDKPFEATPQSLGQPQNHNVHGNDKSGKNVETQKQLHVSPTSSKGRQDNKASEVPPQLSSEERAQYLVISNESERNDGPSTVAPDVVRATPKPNIGINAYAHRNIPTSAFTTPVNQRIRQVQHVQFNTPATPATVDINLTPEYNSDVDADEASNGSVEVRLPDSPPANQRGQSALGRYVRETKSHPNSARPNSSTISLAGSDSEQVSLIPSPEHPSQPEGHAGFSKGVELHQKKSDAVFTLGTPKASQQTPSSSKTAPIPTTPANGNDSASFCPATPFQPGSPAHPAFDSPGTPTPAPKAGKAGGKTVRNIFSSPKLASRSPERSRPNPEIVVAPTTPVAGAADLQYGGSQGLLFQKARTGERDTKNVLNSLKLSHEREAGSGSGSSGRESLDDYEDELAGEKNAGVYQGGKPVPESRGSWSSGIDLGVHGEREVAQAVVVPRVRSHDESEEMQIGDVQIEEEPRKKKKLKLGRSSEQGSGRS